MSNLWHCSMSLLDTWRRSLCVSSLQVSCTSQNHNLCKQTLQTSPFGQGTSQAHNPRMYRVCHCPRPCSTSQNHIGCRLPRLSYPWHCSMCLVDTRYKSPSASGLQMRRMTQLCNLRKQTLQTSLADLGISRTHKQHMYHWCHFPMPRSSDHAGTTCTG